LAHKKHLEVETPEDSKRQEIEKEFEQEHKKQQAELDEKLNRTFELDEVTQRAKAENELRSQNLPELKSDPELTTIFQAMMTPEELVQCIAALYDQDPTAHYLIKLEEMQEKRNLSFGERMAKMTGTNFFESTGKQYFYDTYHLKMAQIHKTAWQGATEDIKAFFSNSGDGIKLKVADVVRVVARPGQNEISPKHLANLMQDQGYVPKSLEGMYRDPDMPKPNVWKPETSKTPSSAN
jgi:hypothetical protein